MKVINKRVIALSSTPMYDVINATPNNNFIISSTGTNLVSHNCGMLDEVDFVKGADAKMINSKVMRIYRSVKRRMESRFMRQGELPGILFLVSSKKSEHDFLEQYMMTQKDNPNVFIVDEPLWNVKPKENYCGKTFKVALS